MLRMADAGYRTAIIDLTAGDMGTRGSPEIRVAESTEAAKLLKVAHRENLHFPDARLALREIVDTERYSSLSANVISQRLTPPDFV